ncbi:MAG TPA: tyrosine-type recombinase/integrase [Ktedonobacteraceae bacterium]|nr:tyrosine-type recombinase/integrase [Ktedonobacteraceae bacterium]
MASSSTIVPFPTGSLNPWIEDYQQACLFTRDAGTIRVYRQILSRFLQWVGTQHGTVSQFDPASLTIPLVERYFADLAAQGYSPSHCQRVKSVLSQFCQWIVEEKGNMPRNPVRGIIIATPQPKAPRVLTPVQRSVLLKLVEQTDRRDQALFALGYFAGCRVTDVVELRLADTHVGPRSGWLHVGGEGIKARDIDLSNQARRYLYTYLQHREHDEGSPFAFVSQRSVRLTDAGLQHWFRALKRQAAPDEERLIADITFHDLRHDFAHRALEAGWALEELAYYLGQLTTKGLPATQTAMRYTQMTRAQVKEKLKVLKS